MTIRKLPLAVGIGLAASAAGAHALKPAPAHADGRLLARPLAPTTPASDKGVVQLATGPLLFVPSTYRADKPAPLIVLLHGAGGDGKGALRILQKQAEKAGALLLAPTSQSPTWDVLRGGFGPDVAHLDDALGETFRRYAIDADRIAIAGFSDGASYALSLGLTNGDLFHEVIAFSPGFAAPGPTLGKPRVFISHGHDDQVLPMDRCSDKLVPRLRKGGYAVEYLQFDGGHSVPAQASARAMAWLANRS